LVCGKNLVQMLASSADVWNAFRDRNPGWVMLNGTCLADAQLAHANLERVFLLASDLRHANLEGASLECAILRKTNLCGSNLRHARMASADLFGANLCGADLRDAALNSCFLMRADLRGADLSTASGLVFDQITEAFGDRSTRLPEYLPRPQSWASEGPQA
jgi:uncharacterized protein YjbI with pentapeptide repeats